MKSHMLNILVCPKCEKKLQLKNERYKQDEIHEGDLICPTCQKIYKIVNYIPRFVDDEMYAGNFGYEFQLYPKTQLDSFSGTTISTDRFKFETNWTEGDLKNNLVLEVGCGAGRFSEFPLSCGADLVSIDLSKAVDVNLKNMGILPSHNLVQASIYSLPFRKGTFDKVFCLGVLQHTPNPKQTFNILMDQVKENSGQLVVNCYQKTNFYMIQPKYLMRPIAKRMSDKLLLKIVKMLVGPALWFGKKVYKLNIPIFSTYTKQFVPNFDDYSLDEQQWVDWGTLIIFDMLSPQYDQPQRIEDVRKWVAEYKNLKSSEITNGIIARITK